MNDPGRLLLAGLVVMAALCLSFMTLAYGLGQSVSGGIQIELDASDPTLFTVVARPPFEQRLLGPQALTMEQFGHLRSDLAGVADAAMVSLWRTSAALYTVRGDQRELEKPGIHYIGVDESYFRLMRLPLAEGRPFTADEVTSGELVCVVGFDRPEKTYHSDPEGDMRAVYRITGRLQPVDGDPFPRPRIWSHEDPQTPRLVMNDIVLTPITARAPVPWFHPMGIEEPPTYVVPLVQPFPGRYEEALGIVTEFMESVWPGWVLDFGVGNEMHIVLEHAGEEVESFFAQIGYLLLALFLVSTIGFMVLHISRSRRNLAVHRALGASRSQVLLTVCGQAIGASVLGIGLGVGGVILLRRVIAEYLGRGITLHVQLAFFAGLILLAGLIAAVAATLWATAPEPAQALRRRTNLESVRWLDLRALIAGGAMLLAVSAVTALLVTGNASVSSLRGYLRSAGEGTVVVDQDLTQATRNLTEPDFLSAEHAEVVRNASPHDWAVVYEAVAPVTIRTQGGPGIAVFAYGLDRPWPEGEGFAYSGDGTSVWGQQPDQTHSALIGSRLAERLFGDADPVGRTIDIGAGVEVKVRAVLAPRPADVIDPLGDRDQCLVVESQVLEHLPGVQSWDIVRRILVYVPGDQDAQAAADFLTDVLAQNHLSDVGVRAVSVFDQVSSLQTLSTKMNRMQLALAWTALLVTALMVGVTAHTQVLERRREFGVKRAVGASPWRVASEVFGVILGLGMFCGLAGAVLGVFLAKRVCLSEGWLLVDPLPSLTLAVAGALLASLLASLWPLSLVVGEEPVTALREGD
ncbi:MAG: ABC transporter permease [Bacillota bacterium]